MPSRIRLLPLLIATAFFIAACDDGRPIVLKTQEIPSPSGSWVAVLEEVDNGMGFGQGALYQEVHILKLREKALSHGDPSSTVVFYAESNYDKDEGVSVRWLDNKHLQILYGTGQQPGKSVTQFYGIDIKANSRAAVSR